MAAVSLLVPLATAAGTEPVTAESYVERVKPLLFEKCVSCHGAAKQEGGLRLDTAATALEGGESGAAVVAGKPDGSLLLERVTADDLVRMPPSDAGSRLTAEQLELLRSWIAAGAPAPENEQPQPDPRTHWAFQPPESPPVPEVEAEWVRSEIDRFLLAEQQRAGTVAVEEASRGVLLRRLSLNLVGLPPTREELQAYLADESPGAWERAVDRLLDSPRYGERWARHFMDVWRYSDPSGYGKEIRDGREHVWRWRDWIVESLNDDKPYDRMIVEMLAADEAAPENPEALRATGFLARNWYKFNRNLWLDNVVEHSSKAFLGLTTNCARCHDHKYDPIDQREFYALRAIFEPHDVRDDPIAGDGELVRAYDAHHDRPTYLFLQGREESPDEEHPVPPDVPEILGGELRIEPVELPVFARYPALRPDNRQRQLHEAVDAVDEARGDVESTRKALEDLRRTVARSTSNSADEPVEESKDETEPDDRPRSLLADPFDVLDEKTWTIEGGDWTIADGRLHQSRGDTRQHRLVSRIDHPRDFRVRSRFAILGGDQYKSVGIGFDGHDRAMHAAYLTVSGQFVRVTLQDDAGTWAYPAAGLTKLEVKPARDQVLELAVRDRLLNVLVDGKLAVAFTLPETRRPGKLSLWTFSATASFDEVVLETLPADVKLAAPDSAPATTAETPTMGPADAVERAEAAAESARRRLAEAESRERSLRARIAAELVKYEVGEGDPDELSRIASHADRDLAVRTLERKMAEDREELLKLEPKAAGDAEAKQNVDEIRKRLETAEKQLAEAEAKLATESTDYSPLGPVYARTSTGRRLALARWIGDRRNPLTARVLVNHVWMRHFGEPLVERVFDFGTRSERPRHAALLDWLAVRFVEDGWSLKALHRRIARSGAYRLSSSTAGAREENLRLDPDNHTLWKMNARRMEAEAVRDSVLHLGGSLDTTRGGPPIEHTRGQTVPRRSLYFRQDKERQMTFLAVFDGANVNECYRRTATVAPQQSLALFNSGIATAESAKVAARFGELDDEAFVAVVFEHVLSRPPAAEETAECLSFLDDLRESASARAQLVRVLFNHHDFVTIR